MKVKVILLRRRLLSLGGCLLAALGIFSMVNFPTAVGVSAATRQLPIYCVQRDQKLVSISFDAAWGDVRVRQRMSRRKASHLTTTIHKGIFVKAK